MKYGPLGRSGTKMTVLLPIGVLLAYALGALWFTRHVLSGVSAAVVGVILVVSIDLAREAIVGIPSIVMAAIAFVSIVVLKVDVAKIAAGAMVCGIVYAGVKALH